MKRAIAFALLAALLATPVAAQNGDAKADLAKLKQNDILVAVITLIVGGLWIRETKDHRLDGSHRDDRR